MLKELFCNLWVILFPLHANSYKFNVYKTQNDRKKVEPKCLKEQVRLASPTPRSTRQRLLQFHPWCCRLIGEPSEYVVQIRNRLPASMMDPIMHLNHTLCFGQDSAHPLLKGRKRWISALNSFSLHRWSKKYLSIDMNCNSIWITVKILITS